MIQGSLFSPEEDKPLARLIFDRLDGLEGEDEELGLLTGDHEDAARYAMRSEVDRLIREHRGNVSAIDSLSQLRLRVMHRDLEEAWSDLQGWLTRELERVSVCDL